MLRRVGLSGWGGILCKVVLSGRGGSIDISCAGT